jgi:hypothetical protein
VPGAADRQAAGPLIPLYNKESRNEILPSGGQIFSWIVASGWLSTQYFREILTFDRSLSGTNSERVNIYP